MLKKKLKKNISQTGLETPGCRMELKAFPNTHDLI